MEAISISKSIQEKHKTYEINPNQELLALGASNMIGSFFQSYPTTGGFSRTAVNNEAGAKNWSCCFDKCINSCNHIGLFLLIGFITYPNLY